MQVLTVTSTGVIVPNQGVQFRGISLTHTAPAACVVKDGAGAFEVGRATIGDASGGADGFMLPGPVPCIGLNITAITAGVVLQVYVE